MEIQVFRSPRKSLINPRLKTFGIALVLTGILTSFLLYLLMYSLQKPVFWGTVVFAALCFIAGLIMFLGCLNSDPHNIHAFALTGDGKLYHITVAIPEYIVPRANMSDMFGLQSMIRERTSSFKDSVELAYAPDFDQKVREAIEKNIGGESMEWSDYSNQYTATATMVKMENPTLEAFSLGCAIIRYHLSTGTEPHRAGLFRHNEGYDVIMNHIQSLSKTGAASNK